MKELFRAIEDTTSNRIDAVLVSSLDAGNPVKALIADGGIVWSRGDHSSLEPYVEEIGSIKETCEIDIDGVSMFCEVVKAEPNLVICGAGHVALACVRMAKILGLHVTVIEDRQDFAEMAAEAGADITICRPFKEALAEFPDSTTTYYLLMTRAHAFDQDCLEMILPKESAYVGMLGSPRKISALKNNLVTKGLDASLFDKLYSPVGLEIGAKTPAEIAVSVMAQIVEHKNEKEKLDLTFTHEIMDSIVSATDASVLCTMVKNNGGTPRTPGTKMLVFGPDSSIGTVGGGAMEGIVKKRAAEMLAEEGCTTEYFHVGIDENREISGMSCGGNAYLLLEKI